MYQLEPDPTSGVISLTATGSTPVELIQTALQGLLVVLRGEMSTGSDEGTAAVPFRGQGSDLGPLFLDLAEDMIGQVEEFGAGLDEVCRHLQIAESTWHRWLAQYGGMKASDAKRLKELEGENARLKKLLAEAELDKAMLKEIAQGNF